jgi:formate dehydrogenase subunit gamma
MGFEKTSRAVWSAEAGSAVIARHASVPGGLMPALQALQESFGYIAADAIVLLANAFNVTRAEVHGVATFYHDFTFQPPRAKHVLKLCRAEACQSVGADALASAAKKKLGVDWHETKKDGDWALEPVFCLGLCACGPSALVDGEPLARLDEKALDAAIKEHA